MVCAAEKCRLVSNEMAYSLFLYKHVTCDLNIDVYKEYRETFVDEPFIIEFHCRDSSLYDLLPHLNVSSYESVEEIIAINCQLPEQYSTLEEKLPKLVRLILEDTFLAETLFDRETKIEKIVANYICDLEVKNFHFFRMPKLKKIDLRWSNPALVLKNYAFADIPHLTHVTIKSCNVKMLPDTLFRNSTNVQHIDFSNNGIENVPNTLFTNLTNLQIIDFSNNKIASIDL